MSQKKPDDAEPPRAPKRMPMLLFFLAVHCGIGVAAGVAFAAAFVYLNIAGVKDLIAETGDPVTPMFMLYAFCALTFGSLSMGIAVMTLPYDDRRGSDGDEPPEPPGWR